MVNTLVRMLPDYSRRGPNIQEDGTLSKRNLDCVGVYLVCPSVLLDDYLSQCLCVRSIPASFTEIAQQITLHIAARSSCLACGKKIQREVVKDSSSFNCCHVKKVEPELRSPREAAMDSSSCSSVAAAG